jgi:hypothetical protein
MHLVNKELLLADLLQSTSIASRVIYNELVSTTYNGWIEERQK